jgi:tight adherence protein C
MGVDPTIIVTIFVASFSLVMVAYLLLSGQDRRLEERVQSLSERPEDAVVPAAPATSMLELARTTLPMIGSRLVPDDEEERTRLRSRLIHAGFYGRHAMAFFLGVKAVLVLVPIMIGFLVVSLGLVSPLYGMFGGSMAGIVGMIGPGFWLDYCKSARQIIFRRALPDALDVIVICLDGGLSLTGALNRVSSELRTVHPELALELNVVQREIQLGRSPGEAIRQMGQRTDLEEIRNIASVIVQSERFGASLVKSLRVHADTLRLKRRQRAEEMAQKAVVKVLFPTLLFIFPAIFVVILGPAAIQITATLSKF